MNKLITFIAGVGFVGFGVAALIDPLDLLASMGLAASGSGALPTELRAFYGGLEIGLGALILWLALRGRMTDALGLTVVTYGSLAAGRIVGILLAGGGPRIIWIALAVEVVFAGLAGWRILAGGKA